MTTKIIIIASLIVVGALVYTGFYLYNLGYEKRKSEEIPHTITDFEKQRLIQEARLNWYPKSTVDSLMKIYPKWLVKINWIDSLNIIDSLEIKDSLPIHFYPVYEADTLIKTFKKDTLGNEVRIIAFLTQRFLPTQKMFASDFSIKSVSFKILPQELPPYESKTIEVYGGIKNKFDKDIYGYAGAEFYFLEKNWFILSLGGEGVYNFTTSQWNGEFKLETKLRF